ncbi:MAG: ABC transporter permease [Chloroflexi bacterium]|nr:ABC transporter permease [Chloroflexota bacterium]
MKRSLAVLGLITIITLLAPWLAPADPLQTDPINALQPPGHDHLLGTDSLGRDVLSRALYGGQRTLLITATATIITAIVGLPLGLATGLSGGWRTSLLVAVTNALLAFPSLLLALVMLTLLGVGAAPLAVATGLAQAGAYARVVYAAVVAIRSTQFIEAAYALGASRRRVLLFHILPNIQPALLAYTGITFSYNLLNSAALSFLGLGGEPGIPDWGVMLAEGRAALRAAPWISLVPGLAITITVSAVHHLARVWEQSWRR